MIGLEGVFTERKPRPTPEKVDATLQVIRERPYELLEKDTHPSAMIKDSKLYINKFVHNEGLIYLGARKFGRTKGYSAEWIAKRIREESEEEAVGILRTWAHQSRRNECSIARIRELNQLTDREVVSALKTMETRSRQLDIKA